MLRNITQHHGQMECRWQAAHFAAFSCVGFSISTTPKHLEPVECSLLHDLFGEGVHPPGSARRLTTRRTIRSLPLDALSTPRPPSGRSRANLALVASGSSSPPERRCGWGRKRTRPSAAGEFPPLRARAERAASALVTSHRPRPSNTGITSFSTANAPLHGVATAPSVLVRTHRAETNGQPRNTAPPGRSRWPAICLPCRRTERRTSIEADWPSGD